MERLAYWIHTQGQSGDTGSSTLIARDELISQLTTYICGMKAIARHQAKAEAKRFLEHIVRDRAGLLSLQGQGQYAFVHRTFQEYLAAMEIRDRQEEHSDAALVHIKEHLHDSHWEEVLLLLIAQQSSQQSADVMNKITACASLHEQWLHRDLLFIGKALAEDIPISVGIAIPFIQELINLSLDESPLATKNTRRAAENVLCDMGNTKLATVVLEQLEQTGIDLNAWESIHYQIALGDRAQTIRLIEDLIERSETSSDIKFDATVALLELSPCSNVGEGALLDIIKDCESSVYLYDSIGNYVQAIPKFSNRFVEALLTLIETETIRRFYLDHFFSVLCQRSNAAIEGLIKLTTCEDSKVRAYAVDVLIDFNTIQWPSRTVKGRISNVLTEALTDPSPNVRICAVYGLRYWEFDEFLRPLIGKIKMLLSDDNQQVRYTAASTLFNIGFQDEEVADVILAGIEAFEKESTSHWNIDKQVLSEYYLPDAFYTGTSILDRSEAMVERVLGLLKIDSARLQSNVLQILSNMTAPSESLVERVYSLSIVENKQVKGIACTTWAKLYVHQQRSLGALEGCLLHEASEIKQYAVIVIDKKREVSQAATGHLKSLIKDPDVCVQLAVIEAISTFQIDDSETVSALLQFLEHEGTSSQAPQRTSTAARTLVSLGRNNPTIIQRLSEWIEHNQQEAYIGCGIDALRELYL